MSDEVQKAIDNINAPSAPVEFTPMPVPEEPKKKTFSSEPDGLEAAAKEVAKGRQEREQAVPRLETDPDGVIERLYYREGERIPTNETISVEKAADDLSDVRQRDLATISPTVDQITSVIDQARFQYHNPQAQVDQQQPQPEPAQAPQTTEQQQQIDGVHPDVVAALQNEHVRTALANEVASVEQARQAYAQQARQAAQLSAASLLSAYPELAQIPAEHLGTAISVIGQRDPQRAQAITAHLQQTQALLNASTQAQQQQQAIQAKQYQQFAEAEDNKFEAAIANEPVEVTRQVKENVASVLETEYGISKTDLRQLWDTQPLMRTAPVQRLLYDITKAKLAERNIATKLDRSVPPVQRPGMGQPTNRDSGVEAALAKFRANPNPATGAALLGARRAAKR